MCPRGHSSVNSLVLRPKFFSGAARHLLPWSSSWCLHEIVQIMAQLARLCYFCWDMLLTTVGRPHRWGIRLHHQQGSAARTTVNEFTSSI